MDHTLFISYSHAENKDGQWVERLKAFLDGVKEKLPLSVWADHQIRPGDQWRREIETAIAGAGAAILLAGRDFLASPFIQDNELAPLLNAADAGRVRLYILVVTYCVWEHSVLEKYQAFNDPAEPLEALEKPRQNRWLNDLCRKVLDDARENGIVPVPPPVSKRDVLVEKIARRVMEGVASVADDLKLRLPADLGAGALTIPPMPIPAPMRLRAAMAAIKDQLDATRIAFVAQARLRDTLYEAVRGRLAITEPLAFEPFFFRTFGQMNDDERFMLTQVRAYTEGPLQSGNRTMLRLVEGHPELRDELPIVAALKQHLLVWLNKYDKVFTTTPQMAVLYVGVEDGVPFPFGVDDLVAEWLALHPK